MMAKSPQFHKFLLATLNNNRINLWMQQLKLRQMIYTQTLQANSVQAQIPELQDKDAVSLI